MPDHDINLLAYARQENLILDGLNQFIDGVGSDDSLKFSQCFNVEVFGYYIENRKEDTIDLVRGANYHFHDLTLNPRGNNGITIKGGAKNIKLENIVFDSHGKECDIELGMWCDYDIVKRPKVRNVEIINCHAKDRKPLVLKCWYSEKPKIVNSNVKVLWWPPIMSPVYFFARRKGWLGKLKAVDPENLKLDPREL